MRFGVAALLLSLLGCFDPCANKVVTEVPAKGGAKTAIVVARDCGATTDFSTQVSILDAGDAVPKTGNVFIADSDHGALTNFKVDVQWSSPDHLVVTYPARAGVFVQEMHVKGVTISYQKTP